MYSVQRMLAGAVMSVLLATAAPAEVGVVVHPNGAVTSYVMQGIVDDPEPIGNAWLRYNADSNVRFVLNDIGLVQQDGRPSMAVSPQTGYPIVAWARNTGTGHDVVLSRFDGSGWTAPEIVVGTQADELDPVVIVDPAGGVHLLYWVHDSTPRVMQLHAPAGLSPWSEPLQVSLPGEVACRPSGVLHDGLLHVAYETHDLGLGSTPRGIVLAWQEGEGYSSQLLATTANPAAPGPQVHSSLAHLWVDWVDTNCEMAWTRQVATEPWEPVRVETYQTTEEREYHVRGKIRALALE
jgi:hypothetical protein